VPDAFGTGGHMRSLSFTDPTKSWTVGSVYCLGKNYRAHAIEMGQTDPRPPVVFIKPAASLTPLSQPITLGRNLGDVHHEVELVIAIALPPDLDATGRELTPEQADSAITAYTIGLDLTRRTIQTQAKQAGEPWSASKGFPNSAPIAELRPRTPDTDFSTMTVRLDVNGETRQMGPVSSMVLSPIEAARLVSRQFPLATGDLIFTGTPSGVGPIRRGDKLRVALEPEIAVDAEVAE
jgi:2-keto-4-pentenoate hydratase/2-oxohepta-3-ene-1,7-dioic acid hydratase in catechol pathway